MKLRLAVRVLAARFYGRWLLVALDVSQTGSRRGYRHWCHAFGEGCLTGTSPPFIGKSYETK
jgi:hypothetical protein